jgi:hypothetical protein
MAITSNEGPKSG